MKMSRVYAAYGMTNRNHLEDGRPRTEQKREQRPRGDAKREREQRAATAELVALWHALRGVR